MPSPHKNASAALPASTNGRGDREPQLFRFGLRQMFALVSGVAVLSTLLAATDGPWPWIIAFSAALVSAHVAGNFLGTRLRDTSEEVKRWRSAHSADGPDEPAATPEPVPWGELGLPPQTPLAWHAPAPRRIAWVVGTTALVAAGAGMAGLALLAGERGNWPALAVGAISCGVIGAWAALMLASFWTIARHAWRHAQGKATTRERR